jgi:RNA polymerase sigma-B factor
MRRDQAANEKSRQQTKHRDEAETRQRANGYDEEPLLLLREYARTGDIEVRNRLVLLHQGLVRFIAARFGAPLPGTEEDLLQVGYIGLIAAIERFDPDKGLAFTTFAVPTIAGEIKRYLRDDTWMIKVPRRLQELGAGLRKLRLRLERRHGRPPSVSEMAAAAEVSEERLLEAMDLERVYRLLSIEAQLQSAGADWDRSFRGLWDGVDRDLAAVEERASLEGALRDLRKREREIIELRFFRGLAQAAVAEELGISQMHVSRLERLALKKLRAVLCTPPRDDAAG